MVDANDLSTVGFNEQTVVGQRTFHVQTEVLNRKGLVIRTTVHEGGIIRVSRVTSHEEDNATVQTVETAARHQHEAVLTDVRRGRVE